MHHKSSVKTSRIARLERIEDKNRRAIKIFKITFGLSIGVGAPATVAALVFVFQYLHTLFAPAPNDAIYVVGPWWTYWCLPAILIGVVIASGTGTVIRRSLLTEHENSLAMEYHKDAYTWNKPRLETVAAVIMIIAGTVIAFAMFGWYLVVKENEIVLNQFISGEEIAQDLSQIESVEYRSVTEENSHPDLIVHFENGFTWDGDFLFGRRNELQEEVYQFLSKKVKDGT